MNNTFVLLRHARSKPDFQIPEKDWDLAPEGLEESRNLTHCAEFGDSDRVYCSEFLRARRTAKALFDMYGENINIDSRLNEISRPRYIIGETEFKSNVYES